MMNLNMTLLSSKELENMKKSIVQEQKERIDNRLLSFVINRVKPLDNPELNSLAAAGLFSLISFEKSKEYFPDLDTSRLGYTISNTGLTKLKEDTNRYVHFTDDPALETARRQLIRMFDVDLFIFQNTHYDECANDYFFRRS